MNTTDSEPTNGPVIQLRGVSKVYGAGQAATHALRGIDLRISRSEFVAVMGPSGSGKSTCVDVRPGQAPRGPGGTRASAVMFKVEDAEAIAREVSGLAAVAPIDTQATQAIFGSVNWPTTITGSTNAYLRTRN